MKLYQYPKCSTCKKAVKWLEEHGISYTSVDIKETPPTEKELKQMLQHYEGDLRKLFNTSGMLYRELELKDKIPDMSEKEALQLLRSNGMLVKRPFLLGKDTGLLGFREAAWEERLSVMR